MVKVFIEFCVFQDVVMINVFVYFFNTGELPELFDEASVDDYIASLNDWDWNMIYYDCCIDKAVIIKLQT